MYTVSMRTALNCLFLESLFTTIALIHWAPGEAPLVLLTWITVSVTGFRTGWFLYDVLFLRSDTLVKYKHLEWYLWPRPAYLAMLALSSKENLEKPGN